ncbi:enoyl-CoA hydratase/isomerase family protein [Variovorax saccharolyticus]|uniref:enoyl-CoA hydratase/isomerase family protein n=1 Tax=Variovorax saccharolyticus TaxID=3053516 RepID=UPI00257757A1|nr:enoyl-CoA hydratase/isomerase family protein [Variovorax sp. J31P216]MDM0028854.1 enoyl-CoA hydratase/isomerase family protein [Variovorax sp. J31P216]
MTSASQIKLTQHTPAYWTATFDNPPINVIGPATIVELDGLIARLESDPSVRVVVFDSANPEFYLAHYDMFVDKATTMAMKPGRSGLHPWLDVLTRLSRVPAATIACIRGRARGAGSEFALACDMRFASRERAMLGQFEVGVGAVPGGGPMARLPRLMGRGRALEVLLGADDFGGELAERYGYVNRSFPDAELLAFVDAFARRLAGFEKAAIIETKRFVDQASLPPDSDFPPALQAFYASVARPETRARSAALAAKGLQSMSDTELRLGHHVAAYLGPGN